jgi:hypothetical protein
VNVPEVGRARAQAQPSWLIVPDFGHDCEALTNTAVLYLGTLQWMGEAFLAVNDALPD